MRRRSAAWRALPEVARHSWPAPSTVEAFERFIEWTWAERAAGRYTCFGVVPRDSITAAGLFELRPLQPGFFRAELGFFIDRPLWGTGVFQDGARLVADFAFKAVGVHRIEVRASVDNARSNAALKKIGAQQEGLLRASFVHDGASTRTRTSGRSSTASIAMTVPGARGRA